ncbi:MAG: hypothetical protein IT228_06425 [Flavobacteriales bacterium]|nr:3-phosphoshikimate 1-carboxyvinyltransferase [Flavobacteriales bacterium]MCC6576961.1 hypothetical protein [Flavobacteriales bacterium]NUQ16817.1 hypothetical protein [Flavobacteriales bacterium]
MPAILTVAAPEGRIRATVRLPRSKSVANRALVAAALAGDMSVVKDAGEAEDTRLLHDLLRDRPSVLHCGLGGTTLRFALAWAAMQEGEERLVTGDKALLDRPHTPLVKALIGLGAEVDGLASGFHVKGRRLRGGGVAFDSPVSSQYLSALMLVGPRMDEGLRIHWQGMQLSRPYVAMTARVMRHFGADVAVGPERITVAPGPYAPRAFTVPRDWSAAAFWYQVVALAPDAEVLLTDLQDDALQGDAAAARLWQPYVSTTPTPQGMLLRSQRGKEAPGMAIDLTDTPDLFQPLALTHAGLGRAATLTGLHNLHLKESDRLVAVEAVLETLHTPAQRVGTDGLRTQGTRKPQAPGAHVFDPQGDHRMAMALAPLALVAGPVRIQDPAVAGKSYPGFWDDLRAAGFRVEG